SHWGSRTGGSAPASSASAGLSRSPAGPAIVGPANLKILRASLVALVCAAFAFCALRPLWGYRDSPTWIYVVFGGFWIALSLAFAVIAARIAVTRRRIR